MNRLEINDQLEVNDQLEIIKVNWKARTSKVHTSFVCHNR